MNALLCGYDIQPLSKCQEWKPETGVRRIRATSLGTVLKTYVCLVHTYSPGLQRWLCRFGDFHSEHALKPQLLLRVSRRLQDGGPRWIWLFHSGITSRAEDIQGAVAPR